nr:coatomer subunit gamma [Quercus suber]
MVVKGFIASELYVTVEPTIVEAREGSQYNVLDGTVDEHIDSIPLQSYQGWAENTRDGYGSEPWQTFPGVNSIEEEEGTQEVHEGEHLSHDELHGGTFENEDDHMLGDDANHIDVTRDDFEEFLDTMGEHEDVDHIEDAIVEENKDTCPGPDPTPEWFIKNPWDNMFDPSPVMQAEVSSWMPGEQPLKGMVDPTTGETEDDGVEDEYQLEDLEVVAADYMLKVGVSNFRNAWESMGDDCFPCIILLLTLLYTEDWIGLKILDEAGKVKFINVSGGHFEISTNDMKTYIVLYLEDETSRQMVRTETSIFNWLSSIWHFFLELVGLFEDQPLLRVVD